MSFLAPLFLLGGLAIALPIVFHLIRQTSREKMTFSSLMFLSSTPPRMTRRSRLENILLLLMRCLVLLLLALGFARPYFKKPNPAPPPANGARKIVVLLDTSASMRRPDLWAEALAEARKALQGLESTDQAAVMTFDRKVVTLVTFQDWITQSSSERAPLAAQRLQAVKPGWAGTHLSKALAEAAETLENDKKKDETPGPREIILISDLQEGGRLEGIQGFEWPRGIELTVVPIQAKRPSNAGMQWVQNSEESSFVGTEDAMRLRIVNSSDSKREEFQVRWEGDTNSEPIKTYVPPGQSRIVLMEKPSGETNIHRAILEGDEADFDNSLHVVAVVSEKVPLIYLGSEAADDPTQPLYYLRRAFQETKRETVEILAHRPDETIPAAELSRSKFLIVTESLPAAQIAVVRSFLEQRKTVLAVLKSAANAASLAELLGISGWTVGEAPDERYAMFGEIKFDHPLLAPFADPRFSDFTKIHFWKHRQAPLERLTGVRVLARFDNGDAALIEMTVGTGSVYILTASWHPTDSQLALSSKFVPLLYSMLELSGGLRLQQLSYSIGDDVTIPSPDPAIPVALRKPDNTSVTLKPEEKFTGTDQPGVYTVTSAQPPAQFTIGLDPLESKTAPISVGEFERFGVPLKKTRSDALIKKMELSRQQYLATEMESQQKLWRRIVLAAFILVVFETFVAAWQTRRRMVQAAEAAA